MTTHAWNPEQYAEHARFVSDLGMPVAGLLSPQPDERVLDLGCGDGALTIKLASLGCEVVGVDSSPSMIAAAKARGLDARVADGRALVFGNEVDAVFSNAALHWMSDPASVVAGVWRALKPGGRFVGEFGGHGNVADIIAALDAGHASRGLVLPCPWFSPHPEEYQSLLEAKGFSVTSMRLFPRSTPLPGDVGGWLETFAQAYTSMLAPAQRAAFVSEIVDRLRSTLRHADGRWEASYVQLRLCAWKPA